MFGLKIFRDAFMEIPFVSDSKMNALNMDSVHSYFRNAYRWYFHDSLLDITY